MEEGSCQTRMESSTKEGRVNWVLKGDGEFGWAWGGEGGYCDLQGGYEGGE